MRTGLVMVLVGLLLMGCRSTDVKQVVEADGGLSGNWSFVYYEATDTEDSSMPGPPFDTLRFVDSRLVYVRQVLHGGPSLCTYAFSGHDFVVKVPLPGRVPVSVRCQAYLADGGGILVLRDRGTGAVFLRSETLVPDARVVVGDWSIEGRGRKLAGGVTLSHGGGIFFRGYGFHGEYRLWRSDAGLMMSAFLFVPGRGLRTVVWRVEEGEKGELRLSPYGPTGLIRKRAMVWRRSVRGPVTFN